MICRGDIEAALSTVFDPCSVQANAPLSVVDMGLVTGLDVTRSGEVRITVRPTSPWCTLVGSIMQGIEDQVGKVDGVASVQVEVEHDSAWSEADLTPAGRRILGGARARSRAVRPARPRLWQERVATTSEV